jgi:phytanoyl-CoA hydroxylase
VHLDDTQRRDWERDGFLVIRDAIEPRQCAALRQRAAAIVEAFDPSTVSIFSTNDQTRTSDEYFLSSGGEVSCFFEEDAFDEDGTLTQSKDQSINKIGHALHDLDPVFDEFSRQRALADIATSIGMADALLLQSMYIFKQPHIGGEVSCHQDATFLWTEPNTVVGLWIALEDATIDNGCLWAQPGGHRSPVRRRFRRDPGGGTRFDELDAMPLPTPGGVDLVPIEAKTGTVVLLHGALPHRSDANRSPRSRQAYTVHLVDGEAPYPADNWLQRPAELPFRGFAGS